jgi:galactose mutarotase-like enzyme
VPTYHDDEYKALQPSNKACGLNNLGSKQLNGGGRFRTKLTDPVTDYVTILSHESHYLQVWTGALATFGVDAVVLEPLSSMSDAFNNHNGLHILDSGETYTNEFSLEIE